MSFGRPGFTNVFKPSPPQRGSFPLDHDGMYGQREKKSIYANTYAETVPRGLMQRDDMINLGLGDVVEPSAPTRNQSSMPQPSFQSQAPSAEKRI
nr:hypothetical protein L203_02236 [Cryptococcus depauperatus CBS 7841]